MTARIVFIAILLCLVSSPSLFSLGENLTVKIAVMGPGDELYFWWGHIALIIEDSVTGRSRFYDYGIFSFQNDNFFYNFAFGRLLYSCGSSSTENSIAVYISTNRDVVIYTMDLPPEKRIAVRDFAEINILPENKDYYYHHFKDNCSTRIRDIIDYATDGQFKSQYGKAPGRFTLRQQVRRHTWFSPAVDWILNFWMGQDIDTPITVWEEMFLPSEVGRWIEEFSYTDSNGVIRKLVTGVEIVNKAEGRPSVLDVPRKQWPRELVFGLILSAIFWFFFFLQAKNKDGGRVLAGLSMSLAGFIFGVSGLLLYFMSLFTNHDYTYHNANMIFSTPLLLATVPLGIRYALIKDDVGRFKCGVLLRLVWLLSAMGVFVSMFIKLLPQFWQQNLTDQMLILPIALVFVLQPVGLLDLPKKFFKHGNKS
jgi:hypothetical protein